MGVIAAEVVDPSGALDSLMSHERAALQRRFAEAFESVEGQYALTHVPGVQALGSGLELFCAVLCQQVCVYCPGSVTSSYHCDLNLVSHDPDTLSRPCLVHPVALHVRTCPYRFQNLPVTQNLDLTTPKPSPQTQDYAKSQR